MFYIPEGFVEYAAAAAVTSTTISITGSGVWRHLYSELPAVVARLFMKMQSVATHKHTRPSSKANNLDSGSSEKKVSNQLLNRGKASLKAISFSSD